MTPSSVTWLITITLPIRWHLPSVLGSRTFSPPLAVTVSGPYSAAINAAAPQISVLVFGDPDAFGDALVRKLELAGAEATVMAAEQSDADLSAALGTAGWTAVAVLTHDDVLALRLTLLCAHTRPDLELWVTLFDRTIVHRLREIVPTVNVVATAELVAAELGRRCADALEAGARSGGVRVVDDALRLLVAAGAGLVTTLLAQTLASMVALHQGIVDALYFSTRSVATVADAPTSATAPAWFKLVSAGLTVIALVLVAIFTAALVRRLSRPRLTTLLGARRAPRHGHVLLVGFGQVGFRLAQELRGRGIPIIALERTADAPCVRLAIKAGIPVALGRGDDRMTLELLGVRRCAAVAAVTSDDLVNVAVGLAARDIRPSVPLVLRLGDGDVATETDSLLHLGSICDAHELSADALAAAILSSPSDPG